MTYRVVITYKGQIIDDLVVEAPNPEIAVMKTMTTPITFVVPGDWEPLGTLHDHDVDREVYEMLKEMDNGAQ